MTRRSSKSAVSRRDFLVGAAAVTVGAALAACNQPTPAPVSKTAVPAAAPTARATAPAPAAAPIAATAVPKAEFKMRAPEANPKRGGTFRMAFGATTSHFDVHQGAAVTCLGHLYNNLIRKNLADGLATIVPDLAVSWEISTDRKIYTFKLRDGVKFSDGEDFTSADVAATFNRIINPPAGVASVHRDYMASVEKVEAVDKMTVKFTLKKAWPPFLEMLTIPAMIIYSKKALDANNQDLKKVIAPGTGAFILKEQFTGEKWVFVKNPNYWDKELPYIDQLEIIHAAAFNDRGTAVLTDRAQLTWNAGVETYFEGLKRTDIVAARLTPNFGSLLTIINNEKKPFNDKRVRRAIHLVVGRQDGIRAFATQEHNFLTRWMSYAAPYAMKKEDLEKLPGYREEKTQDIADAKKLMADAGYANGFGPVDLVSASISWSVEILAPVLQEQLKKHLNIETKIRVVERAMLIEEQKKGTFDLMVGSDPVVSPIADPTPMFEAWYKTGSSMNWPRYSNKDFDAILDQINNEPDEAKRKTLFLKAMDILDEDPPVVPNGFTAHSHMWRNYVKGLALDKRLYSEWGRVETVWLDK